MAGARIRPAQPGDLEGMPATGSRQAATLRLYESAGVTRGGKAFFQARRDALHGNNT